MLVTGLAMPYLRPTLHAGVVSIAADGALAPVATGRSVQFAPGAFLHAIGGDYVEMVVNHQWREHLASTKHGLQLFGTAHGLYFNARFPDTPYARDVYNAIAAKKIQYVCALSRSTEGEDDGQILTITRATLVALNLVLVAVAHQPESWIMPGGEQAELRIAHETNAAERRAFWALGSCSRDDIAADLRQQGDPEALLIADQMER